MSEFGVKILIIIIYSTLKYKEYNKTISSIYIIEIF